MAKKKPIGGEYYWSVTYEYRNQKQEREFWQKQKRGFQKLIKLRDTVYKTECELNKGILERTDDILRRTKGSKK